MLIVVVSSSFNVSAEEVFAEHGVNIGIYANQLSGVAFATMRKTAEELYCSNEVM